MPGFVARNGLADKILPLDDVAAEIVRATSLRAAARMLHRSGFRVRVEGWGDVTGTSPAAGAEAAPGSTVLVRAAVSHAR